MEREVERYVAERPKSKKLHERAKKSLLGGVPMSWMRIWVGPFPVFVKEARGSRLTDVDGHEYLDLCLGDTGALYGHSPEPVIKAVMEQISKRGITTMLPTEDAIYVAEELTNRFGLPYWHVFMTASDVNRMLIKVAREFTGRRMVLTVNGTYHGSVDETLCFLGFDEDPTYLPLQMGPAFEDPSKVTRIVEFNDVDALEKALAPQDIAIMITEPAMTNIGIIQPDPGYHEAMRELTRRYGTVLLIDETHTICAGPAGLTGILKLEPDMLTLGKPLGGGIPGAVGGVNKEIGEMLNARPAWGNFFGFGGTLSGNPMAIAAMRATLENLMTEEVYGHTIALAEWLQKSMIESIQSVDLPWYVGRVGCRVEFRFTPEPPKNGGEALLTMDAEDITQTLTGPVEALSHIYFMNRGIMLTPVHEMALVSTDSTRADVEQYAKVFDEFVRELVGQNS